MKKFRSVFCFVTILFFCLISTNVYASSTKLFKWENTVIEVPVYSNISDYKYLVKSTLYVDGVLSSKEIIAMPDEAELSRISTSHLGSYEVHYGAVCDDASISVKCGRICIVTFNIVDKTKPTLKLTKNSIDIYYGNVITKEDILSYITYSDNYTKSENLKVSVDISNINFYLSGNYQAYFKVTDESGNEANTTLKVNIIREDYPPTVVLLVDELVIYLGEKPIKDFSSYISYSDNETENENLIVNYSTNLNYNVLGEYYVNYVVYDDASNKTEVSLKVLVKVDDKSPSVLYNNSIYLLDYGSSVTKETFLKYLNITDNVTKTEDTEIIPETPIDTKTLGLRSVNIIVIDEALNKTYVTIKINVVPDLIPPTIYIRGSVNLNAKDIKDFSYSDYYTVKDNVTKESDITVSISGNVDFKTSGTYIVSITATDEFNNKSVSDLEINILEDSYCPIIVLNKEVINLEINEEKSESDFLSYASVTNYNKEETIPSIVLDLNDLTFHKEGEYLIYYSLVYGSYTYKISLKVIINKDSTAPLIIPVLSEPYKIRYNSNKEDLITKDSFVYTDNYDTVDNLKIYLDLESLNMDVLGEQTVSFSCSDKCGNLSTYLFHVIVFDDIKPEVSLLSETNYIKILPGYSLVTSEYFNAYDEFDGDLTTKIDGLENTDFSIVGNYFIEISVSDSSLNKTNKYITVRVVDDEVPVLDLKEEQLNYLYDTPFDKEFFLDDVLEVSDNYDTLEKEDIIVDFSSVKNLSGEYSVTYSISDSSNNKVSRILTLYLYSLKNPVLKITNPVIKEGSQFFPLDYIKVTDDSDPRIYNSIVVSNLENLDTNTRGIYNLVISATNSSNCTTQAHMIVTVKGSESEKTLTDLNNSYRPESTAKNNIFMENIEVIIIVSLVVLYLGSKNIYKYLKNKPKDDEV